MSIFDKFLNKKKNNPVPEKSEADTVSGNVPESVPAKEDFPQRPLTYSPQGLLQALYSHEGERPQDLQLVQNILPQVQAKSEQHAQMNEAYERWKAEADAARRNQESSETPAEIPPAPPSSDARAEVVLSQDLMTAFLYLLPPVGEGAGITQEVIHSALESAGVTTGIDEEMLLQLSEKKVYYCIFPIARGREPVKGGDGKIIEHYNREQEIHLQEDSHGNVDHRNLNLFQNIKTGDIICDIIPPENGTDGINVKGTVIPAAKGCAPSIPQGKNTRLNEEGTALISMIDGEISFQNGVFRVESQLTISKNVDSAVGNLDFAGDILIVGDICRGFKVRAGGNVTVYGMVESASVTAGENIDIKKGMNGSGTGCLDAGGNVRSSFLEHANVKAKGDVTADTIINSQIVCGGSVFALSGRGIIIGGSICASKSVEARKIGTLSNNETIIKIGASILQEENSDYLTAELAQAEKTLDMLSKNYRYLAELPSIPSGKMELFRTLQEQKTLYEARVKELKKTLDVLLHSKPDYSKCHVKSNIIYGVTEISLGYSKLIIKETTELCNIYYKENDLVLGTF